MPKLSENDLKIILKEGKFLTDIGYTVSHNEYYVTYSRHDIKFMIGFEPYDDTSNVNILFIDKNEPFDIGWIAFVRDNIKISAYKKTENIISLLHYINKNYTNITNYQYCKESTPLIAEFIQKQITKRI
ncbi:MAG: hypothetical protein IJ583_03190 [Firmicutes bacterium]|nr:hypothetical protein [Bacillota bacterium]